MQSVVNGFSATHLVIAASLILTIILPAVCVICRGLSNFLTRGRLNYDWYFSLCRKLVGFEYRKDLGVYEVGGRYADVDDIGILCIIDFLVGCLVTLLLGIITHAGGWQLVAMLVGGVSVLFLARKVFDLGYQVKDHVENVKIHNKE